ncbi:BCCT family transporter [Thalassotalea psychrophila]|uniref:BCCT family transporter n=1 Tax=Thalassotalea psychrophila TaxID=3065647 RepID=A0ABY9TV79_9GAMM|nr:BCCT family transporter [Colwelliaceae bacterium SQ149]
MFTNIRPFVFWPTFIVLLSAVVLSFVDLKLFLDTTKLMNNQVLTHFSWLFSFGSFYLLILLIIVYFSKLGRIKIGGEKSIPLLSKPKWFSITLCTTLAVGVLFWATAEPIFHLNIPPSSSGLIPGSPQAALFSMSAMFLHWSFTPYAIYTVPALVFALAFYNLKLPFSISSSLYPVMGTKVIGKQGQFIDTIALYALVTGMASSLGTGALTLVGGVGSFTDLKTTPLALAVVITLIVITFILSTASGLQKGIAKLSGYNALLLIFLGIFVFVFGPSVFILTMGGESLGHYISNFVDLSLFTGKDSGDNWSQDWSVFYWAVWFAWAPISALFLGRISRGYTVREFIQINLIFPSLFAIAWISIFSGTAIHLDMSQNEIMNTTLNQHGLERLLYFLFEQLPISELMTLLLVFVAFISYVTAADSNTDAIGNLCTSGFTADSEDSSSLSVKIIWGSVIGIVAWVMVSFVGIDGIKMLSNLGGLPAAVIILLTSLSLWKWLANPSLLTKS